MLSYLWHFNGLELADGPTGNGSTISGSSTPTLTISNAQLADEGQYLVRVFNPCGGATSLDAPLDVNTCPADFNNDGDLNPDDLADYINCYFSSPPCPQADFNADSDTNPDDLSDYINAYFAGCA